MSTESGAKSKQAELAHVYFQRGNDAALKSNFDYALAMYRDALKLVPDNLLYRQAIRGVQRRKFGNDPSKVGWMVGARSKSTMLKARTARARGRNAEAIEACEEIFDSNPWDVHAAMMAAEAAEALEWKLLAKWFVESVSGQAGDDKHFFALAAHIYEINEDWERAIFCWERVKKLDPSNEEALRKTRSLAASATISRSGLGDAINRTPEGNSGPDKMDAKLDELKGEHLTPEQRLLKEIEDEPERIGAYLGLADTYKRQNKLDEAVRILAQGIKAVPGDEVLIAAHAESQIARLQRYIDHWGRKHKELPHDAQAKEKYDKAVVMLRDYEIKEFRRRIGLRGDDLNLRFQLGVRLAAAGQCDEAIGEFQQARNSPALKVPALYQLGLCFGLKDLPKLAERNYQEALKYADPNDMAMINALHYELGLVAENQGDLRAAEEHYNEVAANDYTYKDVAQRLKSLNQKP